ncbi:hypothetical protein ACFL5O_04140 [Myxococcota bacterium]
MTLPVSETPTDSHAASTRQPSGFDSPRRERVHLLRCGALAMFLHLMGLLVVASAPGWIRNRQDRGRVDALTDGPTPKAWIAITVAPKIRDEATPQSGQANDISAAAPAASGESRDSHPQTQAGPQRRWVELASKAEGDGKQTESGTGALTSAPDGTTRGGTLSLGQLGLEGRIARALILDGRNRVPAPVLSARRETRPAVRDVGGLRAGLAASDGLRGLARSSSVVSAAHGAALRFGPAQGNAWFEVQTDAEGRVTSVTLLRFGSDRPAWQRVREELRSRLQQRRLRVPKEAHGVLATLRVSVGPDAALPPKVDLPKGKGIHDTGPLDTPLGRAGRDPSPRAHVYGHEPSPCLSIGTGSFGSSGEVGQSCSRATSFQRGARELERTEVLQQGDKLPARCA